MNSSIVSDYITSRPEVSRPGLQQIRALVKSIVPDVEEDLSYGVIVFRSQGVYILYAGGYQTHIGIYPIPKGNDVFQAAIAPYKKGKGTMQFPIDKKLPVTLIKLIIKTAKQESLSRIKTKKIKSTTPSKTAKKINSSK